MKQSIAILGAAGSTGSTVAHLLAKHDHHILLCDSNTALLEQVAEEISATYGEVNMDIVSSVVDACWEADVIVSTLPYVAERKIMKKIQAVTANKIIISLANSYTQLPEGMDLLPTHSAAEELQRQLPQSNVVKVLNVAALGKIGDGYSCKNDAVDIYIAGDNQGALGTVREVIKSIGLNPVTAGTLAASRTLEGIQYLLSYGEKKNNYSWVPMWNFHYN